MISAIILSRPDSKKLGKCLKSLKWVDETIVVKGLDISDFSKIRNKAAKKAKGDWIFYVDDDERVPLELAKEIQKKVKATKLSAFDIPRKNMIFGKWFRHSGQWPDRVMRLMRKKTLVRWEGKLHEQPKIKGETGSLTNFLIHEKHDNLDEMVDKTNVWSEVEAKLMYDARHPKVNVARFTTAMLREFWLRMIRQTAFLDGTRGIIYGLYQVYSRFISYAKLWEMQITKK